MALALQAATLIRGGNQRIADLFCSARLTENLGLAFGTLRSGDGVALLLDRSRPRRNDKLTRIPNFDPQIPRINADSDWFELTRNRSVAGAEIERACSFAIH
jgi:hypothetical protein